MKISVITDDLDIVKAYGVCLIDKHNPIKDGVLIDISLDLNTVDLVDNYKVVGDKLVKLAEIEKPKIIEEPTELEVLKQEKEILAQSVYEMAEIIELILMGGIE